MGLISNVGNFLTDKLRTPATQVSDMVTRGAALSPEQVEGIEKKREAYLAELGEFDEKSHTVVNRTLGEVGIEVYQVYLEQLKELYKPMDTVWGTQWDRNCINYFDITKLVTDPEEKNLDKLVNVYQVLREEECNIALIYHRTREKCTVTLGVVNTGANSDPTIGATYYERLLSAIKGNFPGIEVKAGDRKTRKRGIPECLKGVLGTEENRKVSSVAIVSNLASEKSEDFISQSMEKLLDGIVPKNEEEEYTLVLLAKTVRDNLERQNRIFEMCSEMAPYASWQTNYNYTNSDVYTGGANVGAHVGKSQGKSSGVSAGAGGANLSSSKTSSTNFGLNFSRSASVSVSVGENKGITQTNTNYAVKHTLDLLDEQMKRLEESSALGAWEFAAYVVSKSPIVANNVAHMYLALTQGEQSFITKAAVSLWDGMREKDETSVILKSVQRLQHPVFGLNLPENADNNWLMYPTLITPSVLLSGKELARSLNLPRKSVSGLPVFESAAFGREVQTFNEKAIPDDRMICVGNIYHMRQQEAAKVNLDADSFTSHVFITGSTGTGKSNAIYQLLSNLESMGVKYLVIEPAKGEYKKVFGGKCHVYGTNYKMSDLLCINPFSFPEEVLVLEHIDRLVEIFNACWPMYAAMPAVLKDAIEKAYESVGWNLQYSVCEPRVFPTFVDLLKTLPEVMESSLYSSDTKSDYSGALVTRVRSLTNGINGQIFCSHTELTAKELFEENVIVDLSRVGSNETKALLMGILMMKLQEYRVSLGKMNSELIHVTVLEEAHNLLRKTSTEQSQESANLQGKAVEMLTNAIAEMRSYGEGFIIADQAPNLLDEAVIRNTNTKIVLRLPDEDDRVLVGSSIALRDDQIKELAKLPMGVAAVYQNDWVEAVLCQFEKYDEKKYCPLEFTQTFDPGVFSRFFIKVFDVKDSEEMSEEEVDAIREWINSLRDMNITRQLLSKVLDGEALNDENKQIVAYNIFHGDKVLNELKAFREPEKGLEKAKEWIRSPYNLNDDQTVDLIIRAIITYADLHFNDVDFSTRYNLEELERRNLL